jgi:hypothetical protein
MGLSFLIAFAVAFWSANNGIKTLFEALNIAYREREKRSFIRLNLLAFTFTLASWSWPRTLIGLIGILPAMLALLPVDETTDLVLRYARWPVLLVMAAARHRHPLPLRTEPRARALALGQLGRAACLPGLARRLGRLLLLSAGLCRLQRDLRFAGRGHRLHDVDVDFRHRAAGRRPAQRRDRAPDRRRHDDRQADAHGHARRDDGRHAWRGGRRRGIRSPER